MSAYLLLVHLLNFLAAPAAVAVLLVFFSRFFVTPNLPWVRSPAGQVAIVFGVNTFVMALSLLVLGQDGRIAGYAAMVLGAALCQWALLGSWRD